LTEVKIAYVKLAEIEIEILGSEKISRKNSRSWKKSKDACPWLVKQKSDLAVKILHFERDLDEKILELFIKTVNMTHSPYLNQNCLFACYVTFAASRILKHRSLNL